MPGWKRRSRAASTLLGLVAGAVAYAADPRPGEPPGDEASPPAAFLEFIGEWSDQQGNVQDPLQFEDPKWRVLDNDAERHDDKD